MPTFYNNCAEECPCGSIVGFQKELSQSYTFCLCVSVRYGTVTEISSSKGVRQSSLRTSVHLQFFVSTEYVCTCVECVFRVDSKKYNKQKSYASVVSAAFRVNFRLGVYLGP